MADPIRIRASSFGELLDCAHRFEGKYLLGLSLPSSGRARLGTAVHAGTAAFDHAKVLGKPIRAGDAVDAFLASLRSKDEPVRWEGDLRLRDAEDVGAVLTVLYCTEISPSFSFAAVELELRDMVIECGDGVAIKLTGTMDRGRVAVGNAGGLGVADIKTGQRVVDSEKQVVTKGHAAQLGVYELLAEHTLGQSVTQPAAIIGLKTSMREPVAAVGYLQRPRDLLVGTHEVPGLLDYAADTLKSGLFRPNPASVLCSEKFCARWSACRYHE